jgi:membrane-associated protease RseP (regulator of RpoE activity)
VKKPFPTLNVFLFLATVVTTLLSGGLYSEEVRQAENVLDLLLLGVPFSASLLAILVSHEMGHYLLARHHKVSASLPYFLPVPVGPVGTFGAFIKIRSALPSRDAVLDIGAAGPIAGFLVAAPLLFWGFSAATVELSVPTSPNAALQSPASLVWALLRGEDLALAQTRVQVMGDSLLTWAAAHLTHDLPKGADLRLGPVGAAAWIGLYVTTLNLLPVGQLDGGHVVYALFGERAERVSRAAAWGILGVGLLVSWSWLLWWLIVRLVVGLRHPPAVSSAPLSPARRVAAITSLVLFAATFIPVPFYL